MKSAKVFLVSVILLLLSQFTPAHGLSKVVNIFQENVTVKQGDVLQCEIININLEKSPRKPNYHACSGGGCYSYYPVSGKCFSYKIKTPRLPHIILGKFDLPSVGDVEVVFNAAQQFLIREKDDKVRPIILKSLKMAGAINNREHHGFWIRWLDDELVEVGRESDTTPFLFHRFPRKLQIDYVGIMTPAVFSDWIIDGDPKCPGPSDGTKTEGQKEIIAESECMIL